MVLRLVRTFKSALILVAALILLPLESAQALIVFLDVNNNPGERASYRTELLLGKRSESFVSIPENSESSATLINSLARQRDETWVKYVNEGCFAAESCHPPSTGRCGLIHAAVRGLEAKVSAVPQTRLTLETLSSDLEKLKLKPDEKITLVISGHFAGGSFTGNLGSITTHDIEAIFDRYPQLRQAVTKLHLLGCYTNTLSQIDMMWRRIFPNARVIAGFFNQSPLGSSQKNLTFIRALVRYEDKLEKAKSERDFQALMHGLEKIKISFALTIGDFYQTSQGSMIRVSESRARGSICEKVLSKNERDEFQQILSGVQGVPVNTSHSNMRTYYSDLRNNLMCLEEPKFRTEIPNTPHPDQLIRVIFYRNVLTNFMRMHQSDIANFNALLQSSGVPAYLGVPHVDMYDRKALNKWHDDVLKVLTDLKPTRPSAEIGLKQLENFKRVIVNVDPYCIPIDWLEPSGFQRSVCFTVPGECK